MPTLVIVDGGLAAVTVAAGPEGPFRAIRAVAATDTPAAVAAVAAVGSWFTGPAPGGRIETLSLASSSLTITNPTPAMIAAWAAPAATVTPGTTAPTVATATPTAPTITAAPSSTPTVRAVITSVSTAGAITLSTTLPLPQVAGVPVFVGATTPDYPSNLPYLWFRGPSDVLYNLP
jgi:hypothetical protein